MTRDREGGYALAGLLAAVTIMMIGLAVAMPSWKYVIKNDREEELIFRGGQIADAIARYQKKNANALPPSLEVLVKGKYLRKAWPDPVTKDGKWRFIRQGESLTPTPTRPGGPSPAPPTRQPSPSDPSTRIAPLVGMASTRTDDASTRIAPLGGFIGVASTNTDQGLRLFNGRTKYNEWVFAAGQPRVIGKQPVVPGPRPGAQPGTTLTPLPSGQTQPQSEQQ